MLSSKSQIYNNDELTSNPISLSVDGFSSQDVDIEIIIQKSTKDNIIIHNDNRTYNNTCIKGIFMKFIILQKSLSEQNSPECFLITAKLVLAEIKFSSKFPIKII